MPRTPPSDIVGLKATLNGLKVARNTVATSKDGHTRDAR